MLLLLLSDCDSGCSKQTQNAALENAGDADDYALVLEKRLVGIISDIDGAGEVRVMVTLQNDVKYVYASADKTSIDSSENAGESSKLREDTENSYIILDTDEGEQALVCTRLMPSVEGVVIVCEGADDPQVAERIMLAVTTALGISPNRVCIALMKK